MGWSWKTPKIYLFICSCYSLVLIIVALAGHYLRNKYLSLIFKVFILLFLLLLSIT